MLYQCPVIIWNVEIITHACEHYVGLGRQLSEKIVVLVRANNSFDADRLQFVSLRLAPQQRSNLKGLRFRMGEQAR